MSSVADELDDVGTSGATIIQSQTDFATYRASLEQIPTGTAGQSVPTISYGPFILSGANVDSNLPTELGNNDDPTSILGLAYATAQTSQDGVDGVA